MSDLSQPLKTCKVDCVTNYRSAASDGMGSQREITMNNAVVLSIHDRQKQRVALFSNRINNFHDNFLGTITLHVCGKHLTGFRLALV